MYTPSARGGHPRYTRELLLALREAAPPSELRLTLLTSVDLAPEFRTGPYELAAELPPLRHPSTFPSRVHWAVGRTLHYARREEQVLRWVRARGGADVLHYQEPPFASPLHLARARAGGVVPVATVHNLRPHRYPVAAVRPLADLAARLGWLRCGALFVHSAGLRDALARDLGPRAPPIVVVPHGVWSGQAPVAAPRRDGYLLLFGVMRANKGLHLALDALHHLPGQRLVLAGAFPDQGLARALRRRAEAEGLAVEIVDREIPEAALPGLYAGAALALLPYTDFHAQSGVLHLALAFGVPAVVTDVGALGEEVRREGIGEVAAAVEPGALAAAVRAALAPPAWDGARARCLAVARTRSWATAAALTLDAYRRAARSRRGGIDVAS
jgi:glycosyltransferase involved in cell wall biosynthesis